MAFPSGEAEAAECDPWFIPVWNDGGDEPIDPGHAVFPPRRTSGRAYAEAAALLAPLAAAQDALARLDARTEAAPPPIRDGLVARLVFREAAGWLAYRQAWVHPLDLALREAGLVGATEMPNTAGPAWDGLDLAERLKAEAEARAAQLLARLLRRLVGCDDPLDQLDPDGAFGRLTTFPIDPARFAGWRARISGPATDKVPLPPLLRAAEAAGDWMEAGITEVPAPVQAMAAGAAWLARAGCVRAVPLPFWAAAPALAQSARDQGVHDQAGLPTLRPQAARRLGLDDDPSWPATFLALAAEAARAGLRELDRLEAAAAAGARLTAGLDRRSRLPEALAAVLHCPAVTAKGLAASLDVTPQAALRLIAELARAGIVRETTGRRSFRAFALAAHRGAARPGRDA
jgi:hypothetical protein